MNDDTAMRLAQMISQLDRRIQRLETQDRPAGGTAGMSAASILSALLTVDGASSGLDADLLDGAHASAFAGVVHSHGYVGTADYVGGTILAKLLTVDGAASGLDADLVDGLHAADLAGAHTHDAYVGTAEYVAGSVLAKLLTVDGTGSGLDADLLDGVHAAGFVGTAEYTAGSVLAKLLTVDGPASLLDADTVDGYEAASLVKTADYTAGSVLAKLLTVDGTGSLLDADFLDGVHAAGFVGTAEYAAGSVLAKLLTVDGTGSGLDADLVDGQHAAEFSGTAHTHSIYSGTAHAHAQYIATGGTAAVASVITDDIRAATSGTSLTISSSGGQGGLHLDQYGITTLGGTVDLVPIGQPYILDVTNHTRIQGNAVIMGTVGLGIAAPENHLHLHGTTPNFRISSAAADQNATILWMDNNADLKGRLTYRGANAAGSKYFGFVNDGGDYLRFESTYMRLVGNVMVGNYVAQSPFHVYNGTGGAIFSTKTAIDTTAQVILANGTGDVTKALWATVVMHNGTASGAATAVLTLGGTTTQDIVCGTSTYQVRLNADGSLDVRRTAGTAAGTIVLWGIWL